MRSTCKRKLSLALTGLLPGVLLLSSASTLCAQPANQPHPVRGNIAQFDAAHEVTINGTVQQVTAKRTAASPAGMHLLVSGAQGLVDAHVGPYLSKNIQEALHAGLPIQIVGAMETVRGKQYLLARQLNYGGQTVTVRNNNGFLLRPAQSTVAPRARKVNRSRLSGGAQ